jgi:ketosteroid isomerase-like protein
MNVAREIAALLENRAAAIADHDVDGVLQQIAPDIVSFDVGKPLAQTGIEGVRRRLQEWFSAYDGTINFICRDLAVHGGEDIAFSHALVHISGRLNTGTVVSMWVRSTIGWIRKEQRWLAAHEHMSDPMDFETGRTLTDLKPD